jgi:mannose-6-phosphate isomerase-like protein (cupin superfamily)
MHRSRRDSVKQPLVKSHGESVFELVGARDSIGGASSHSLAEIVIRPGGSSAGHHHLRSEETYYVLKGSGRLVVDGEEHQLSPGDACFIEVGERHQVFNDGEEELVLLAVSGPPWVPEDSVFS